MSEKNQNYIASVPHYGTEFHSGDELSFTKAAQGLQSYDVIEATRAASAAAISAEVDRAPETPQGILRSLGNKLGTVRAEKSGATLDLQSDEPGTAFIDAMHQEQQTNKRLDRAA